MPITNRTIRNECKPRLNLTNLVILLPTWFLMLKQIRSTSARMSRQIWHSKLENYSRLSSFTVHSLKNHTLKSTQTPDLGCLEVDEHASMLLEPTVVLDPPTSSTVIRPNKTDQSNIATEQSSNASPTLSPSSRDNPTMMRSSLLMVG